MNISSRSNNSESRERFISEMRKEPQFYDVRKLTSSFRMIDNATRSFVKTRQHKSRNIIDAPVTSRYLT